MLAESLAGSKKKVTLNSWKIQFKALASGVPVAEGLHFSMAQKNLKNLSVEGCDS